MGTFYGKNDTREKQYRVALAKRHDGTNILDPKYHFKDVTYMK